MNSIAVTSNRVKFFQSTLARNLRVSLVAEKICNVDRTDEYVIYNPYITTPTTTVQALTGTYGLSTVTTTVDTLTVQDEFVVAGHVYDFERVLSNFDLLGNFVDEMTYSVRAAIDVYVLNNLCEECTGSYDTPTGGFTSGNLKQILGDLSAKVAGYDDNLAGMYLVVENTDVSGILQGQMDSGFGFADAALNNGLIGRMAMIDIYVVRTGTFQDATFGASGALANLGHRLFGIKGVSTYCAPRGVQYTEKDVTLKTGKEVEAHGYIGFKAWIPKRGVTVDITLK